jgi:hypothetical protein
MNLNFITDGSHKTLRQFNDLGLDQESLIFIVQEILKLQKDLQLENGDLRDLIFRMRNRYDHLRGHSPDVRIKCEDTSPSRITFQPNGYKHVFFFTRCANQHEVPYKQATFFCELCGTSPEMRKKEIKSHVVNVHKVNLVVY